MKTWITTIGQKPLAAVNTLWAAFAEESVAPIGKLVILHSEDMKKNVLTFTTWAEALFSEYQKEQPRLKTVSFPTDDIQAFRKLLRETVSKTPGSIFLDMSSGRKAMSALTLLIGELFPGKVEKVYYSFLRDQDYTDFPYAAIPLQAAQLYNLMEK